MTYQQSIDRLTETFVIEIQTMIRELAVETVSRALGVPTTPALPAPSKGTQHEITLTKLRRAGRAVTTKDVAKTLNTSESGARTVLSKLLRQRLVKAVPMGDGTKRKLYLPVQA